MLNFYTLWAAPDIPGVLCPGVCLGWGGQPGNCIVLEQVKD